MCLMQLQCGLIDFISGEVVIGIIFPSFYYLFQDRLKVVSIFFISSSSPDPRLHRDVVRFLKWVAHPGDKFWWPRLNF